jgi:hypothetical protein
MMKRLILALVALMTGLAFSVSPANAAGVSYDPPTDLTLYNQEFAAITSGCIHATNTPATWAAPDNQPTEGTIAYTAWARRTAPTVGSWQQVGWTAGQPTEQSVNLNVGGWFTPGDTIELAVEATWAIPSEMGPYQDFSPWSATVSVTYCSGQPTNADIDDVNDCVNNYATLSWTAGTYASTPTSHQIQRRQIYPSITDWVDHTTATGTATSKALDLTDVPYGRSVQYRVKAVFSNGTNTGYNQYAAAMNCND